MKEIYEQYYTQLVYFGLKLIKNNQVVEDIVLDCIIKFFDKGYEIKLANGILYTCVKNSCLNYIRSQKTHNKINKQLFNDEFIDLQIIETMLVKTLMDAVDALPPDCRNVIIMYYLEEKNSIQIAQLLNKKPSTIRSLKKYGLDKLKLKNLK